jgi:hypothetical protein
MKHPTFFEGIAVALIASLAGSTLFAVLSPYFSIPFVLRVLITLTGLSYGIYLLGRSPVRVGRVTAAASWILVTVLSWILAPSPLQYLAIHLAAIWLIRSLYFYASLFPALADLGLSAMGLSAALWAFFHTGSLFAAIWCLFLVQALFVFIPAHAHRNAEASHPDQKDIDQFERAYGRAQSALHRLSLEH